MMTEREKMEVIVKIAGFVQANPKPRTDRSPPDRPRAFLSDLWKRFSGTASAALWTATLGLLVLAASSIGGLGLGHNTSLLCVTMAPLTT